MMTPYSPQLFKKILTRYLIVYKSLSQFFGIVPIVTNVYEINQIVPIMAMADFSGGSRERPRETRTPPPLFLDHTEALRAKKKYFLSPPAPPPPPPYLKVCISHFEYSWAHDLDVISPHTSELHLNLV